MNSVETILKQMKADIVTAQTSGTNASQVQSDITAQQQSLISIMNAASFNGVNLLDGSTTNTNIVDSFSRSTSGTTTGVLTVNTAAIALGGAGSGGTSLLGASLSLTAASTSTVSADTAAGTAASGAYAADSLLGFKLTSNTSTDGVADLSKLATAIDTAITNVTAARLSLVSTQQRSTTNSPFTSSISDAITSGVGSLVDADMNVASTRSRLCRPSSSSAFRPSLSLTRTAS